MQIQRSNKRLASMFIIFCILLLCLPFGVLYCIDISKYDVILGLRIKTSFFGFTILFVGAIVFIAMIYKFVVSLGRSITTDRGKLIVKEWPFKRERLLLNPRVDKNKKQIIGLDDKTKKEVIISID